MEGNRPALMHGMRWDYVHVHILTAHTIHTAHFIYNMYIVYRDSSFAFAAQFSVISPAKQIADTHTQAETHIYLILIRINRYLESV